MIKQGSWLDVAATPGALVDAEGRTVPANITRDGVDYVLVGCDLGNSAIKIVLRQADVPQLRAFRFEAVYTRQRRSVQAKVPLHIVCCGTRSGANGSGSSRGYSRRRGTADGRYG